MKKRKITDDIRLRQEKNVLTAKGQVRDVNSRTIFKDSMLVAQFLRDNLDIPILKNVKPEDIEDVTERYQAYLGISFETDTVKRIWLREAGEDSQIYLVSLIEHKSEVDYNISMQLLRYMVCIWDEYAREAEKQKKGITKTKGFKYPAILPIVYYEGSGNWTPELRLQDRIMLKEVLGEYIPDFTYRLVRIHDYTNEELLSREDEMSLLMMINKVQTAEDMTQFLRSDQDKIREIVSKDPSHVLDIIAFTIWSLCMKMNMPVEDAAECVRKVEDRDMGYLFENMEKMDIQEERRQRKEAEQRAEKIEGKLKEKEIQMEKAIESYVQLCQEFHVEKDDTVARLAEKYHLSPTDAKEKVRIYWKD